MTVVLACEIETCKCLEGDRIDSGLGDKMAHWITVHVVSCHGNVCFSIWYNVYQH